MGIVPSIISIFTDKSSSSSKPKEPVQFMNISLFNDPMINYVSELSTIPKPQDSWLEQNKDVLLYGSLAILILYLEL